MMEWSFEGQMEVAQAIANQWGEWMRANGVQEVIVEVEGVGTRAAVSSQVQHQGQWVNSALPVELVRLGVDLRVAMGRPGGGAWTWARLSMSSSQGYKLVSDFNYDREPVLDPPYTAQDVTQELEAFPREPNAIPDWMRIGG